MGIAAKNAQRLDDIGDIVFQEKLAVSDRNIARIDPIHEKEIVIGQQSSKGVANQR